MTDRNEKGEKEKEGQRVVFVFFVCVCVCVYCFVGGNVLWSRVPNDGLERAQADVWQNATTPRSQSRQAKLRCDIGIQSLI